MAKFCTQCGARMEDDDRVCGQCGTPASDAADMNPAKKSDPNTPGTVNPGSPANAIGKNKGMKWIVLIIAVVAAIVACVIAVKVVSNFTGYKGTVRKMVRALQKDDVDALESMASSISDVIKDNDEDYEEDYDEEDGEEEDDYYESLISATLDKYEDKVGAVKSISYEITDTSEISDRRLDKIKENLIDYYNMDTTGIKKIVKVDLRLKVKGENKSSIYDVEELNLVKEDGGWKIHYGSLDYLAD